MLSSSFLTVAIKFTSLILSINFTSETLWRDTGMGSGKHRNESFSKTCKCFWKTQLDWLGEPLHTPPWWHEWFCFNLTGLVKMCQYLKNIFCSIHWPTETNTLCSRVHPYLKSGHIYKSVLLIFFKYLIYNVALLSSVTNLCYCSQSWCQSWVKQKYTMY